MYSLSYSYSTYFAVLVVSPEEDKDNQFCLSLFSVSWWIQFQTCSMGGNVPDKELAKVQFITSRTFPYQTFPYFRLFPTSDVSLPRLFPTSDVSLPRRFPTKTFPYQDISLLKLYPTKAFFTQISLSINGNMYCIDH